MFFTREDILKIQNALLKLSVKDSELPSAEPVTYDDTLSIVQEGKNKQIKIEDFFNQISLWKREDFINITDKYDEHYISLIEAINLIPILQRKDGLVITFQDIEGNWEIYQFRGNITEFLNEEKWFDLYDYRNNIIQSIVPDEEDLTASTPDKKGNSLVSLKDRVYDPTSFSGKGYKILRKNIQSVNIAVTKIKVEFSPSSDGILSFSINGKETQISVSVSTDNTTILVADKIATKLTETMTEYEVSKDTSTITLTRKFGGSVTPSVFSASTTGLVCTVTDSTKREFRNILTPIMLNQPNTIYEIRYEFNLGGAEVVIPEGCVLDFQGGSLSNGTINGNLTIIQGNTFGIFDSIIILGEWNVRTISSNMFKTLKEENSIKNVFNLSNSNVTNKIIIENNGYDYLVTNGNPINLTSNSNIEINGIIKIVPNSASSYCLFDSVDVSNINIYGCGKFIGDRDEHSYIGETTHEWGYGFQFRGNVDNIRISGLFFTDFTGGSIRFNDKTSNIKIENVTTERNRAGGIEFTGGAENIIISNCNFKDVGIDTEHSTYTAPGDSIGIEPNYHIGLDNINIENCKFVNCRLPIYITNGYEMGGSFSVRGCTIEGGLFNLPGILFGNMKFINIENCRISDMNHFVLICNNDYKKLSIKNNYITSKGGILYYLKNPTGFSNIENNQFKDEGTFSIKGLKNCNFINNLFKTNGAFVQDSQSSIINFINNKIDGLFCYSDYRMVLNDSIIAENTFIQPTSQNAIWFSGENIKIKNNNFITDKELESSRTCLYLTDASNIVISENLFATKINSMNYYIISSNSSNIYLLNNIFSEKEINDRYTQGDGIIFIKDGEYRTHGSSDKRPIIPIDKYLIGKLYFDTTLNKPIWWTGTKWVDATGADI